MAWMETENEPHAIRTLHRYLGWYAASLAFTRKFLNWTLLTEPLRYSLIVKLVWYKYSMPLLKKRELENYWTNGQN